MKVETGSSVVVEEKSTIVNRQSSIVSRPSSITLPLLLEVGCEEIPARFLSDAEKGLGERVQAALQGARVLPPIDAYRHIPRRAASLSTSPPC
jgi:hypothetical protein